MVAGIGGNNFGLDRESISIAEFTQIDFRETGNARISRNESIDADYMS